MRIYRFNHQGVIAETVAFDEQTARVYCVDASGDWCWHWEATGGLVDIVDGGSYSVEPHVTFSGQGVLL